MKKTFLCCICFISFQIHAQFTPEGKQVKDTLSFLERTEFKAGYFGNILWNQGLNVGAEYLWKEKIKIKERKRGGQKRISNQFLFNGSLGFTFNPSTTTDTGVFTHYGLIWRRTNTKGKQFSITLNPLGYYRSILPETYEVKNDRVERVFFPGRSYYAPSMSIGFGKFRKNKKLTGRYFNINLMLQTPYNAGTLPSVFLEYGYRFNFKKKKRDANNN
ncbi:hypothetical protein [Aquimarina mytili]|uniref:DUF2490 domain-containing protein n=1 Tax=Aquimarina mytili TaxID=874423 RepID=A0A936ZRB7_9FLAO|nr:hypothetical protein [Aquimarina mytili]MBL0682882.1 hypothetical protein [Aquimarina mytili]